MSAKVFVVLVVVSLSSTANVSRRKTMCNDIPPQVLGDILGPAFNSRYMSIDLPPEIDPNAVLPESGVKRAPSNTPAFYVEEDFAQELGDSPAWITDHLKVKTGNFRSKRDLYPTYNPKKTAELYGYRIKNVIIDGIKGISIESYIKPENSAPNTIKNQVEPGYSPKFNPNSAKFKFDSVKSSDFDSSGAENEVKISRFGLNGVKLNYFDYTNSENGVKFTHFDSSGAENDDKSVSFGLNSNELNDFDYFDNAISEKATHFDSSDAKSAKSSDFDYHIIEKSINFEVTTTNGNINSESSTDFDSNQFESGLHSNNFDVNNKKFHNFDYGSAKNKVKHSSEKKFDSNSDKSDVNLNNENFNMVKTFNLMKHVPKSAFSRNFDATNVQNNQKLSVFKINSVKSSNYYLERNNLENSETANNANFDQTDKKSGLKTSFYNLNNVKSDTKLINTNLKNINHDNFQKNIENTNFFVEKYNFDATITKNSPGSVKFYKVYAKPSGFRLNAVETQIEPSNFIDSLNNFFFRSQPDRYKINKLTLNNIKLNRYGSSIVEPSKSNGQPSNFLVKSVKRDSMRKKSTKKYDNLKNEDLKLGKDEITKQKGENLEKYNNFQHNSLTKNKINNLENKYFYNQSEEKKHESIWTQTLKLSGKNNNDIILNKSGKNHIEFKVDNSEKINNEHVSSNSFLIDKQTSDFLSLPQSMDSHNLAKPNLSTNHSNSSNDSYNLFQTAVLNPGSSNINMQSKTSSSLESQNRPKRSAKSVVPKMSDSSNISLSTTNSSLNMSSKSNFLNDAQANVSFNLSKRNTNHSDEHHSLNYLTPGTPNLSKPDFIAKSSSLIISHNLTKHNFSMNLKEPSSDIYENIYTSGNNSSQPSKDFLSKIIGENTLPYQPLPSKTDFIPHSQSLDLHSLSKQSATIVPTTPGPSNHLSPSKTNFKLTVQSKDFLFDTKSFESHSLTKRSESILPNILRSINDLSPSKPDLKLILLSKANSKLTDAHSLAKRSSIIFPVGSTFRSQPFKADLLSNSNAVNAHSLSNSLKNIEPIIPDSSKYPSPSNYNFKLPSKADFFSDSNNSHSQFKSPTSIGTKTSGSSIHPSPSSNTGFLPDSNFFASQNHSKRPTTSSSPSNHPSLSRNPLKPPSKAGFLADPKSFDSHSLSKSPTSIVSTTPGVSNSLSLSKYHPRVPSEADFLADSKSFEPHSLSKSPTSIEPTPPGPSNPPSPSPHHLKLPSEDFLSDSKSFGSHITKRSPKGVRQWECESRIRWLDLGPDYFPRYLRSVECTSHSCWYDMLRCKPRSFTVKLLRRKRDSCVPLDGERRSGSVGLPAELRQLWLWEERAVNFCCDCAIN